MIRRSLRRTGLGLAIAVLSSSAAAQLQFEDQSAALDLDGSLTETWGLNWGDLDGDGYPDLYFGNHRHYSVLSMNQRDGTFDEQARDRDLDGIFTSGWSERDVHAAAWGDLDNDGDQDLVNTVSSTASQQFTNDNGLLSLEQLITGENAARQPLLIDTDNDGILDINFIAYSGGIACNGRGEWGIHTQLNNDGRLDVMCSNRAAAFPDETVTFGDGADVVLPQQTDVIDAISGDFDGDLLNDLVYARGALRPNGVFQANDNTFEVASRVTGVAEKLVTIDTSGALTFTAVDGETWRRFSFDVFYIGAAGYNPSTSSFTLDPNDPANHGEPSKLPIQRSFIRVWYDPALSTWFMKHAANERYDTLSMVIQSDTPIASVDYAPLLATDLPMQPTLFLGSTGGFVDSTAGSGLMPEQCASVVAGDFDNDMDLDLYFTCRGGSGNLPNVFYENDGLGNFTRIASHGAEGALGGAVYDLAGTSGEAAIADYDLDGFLDLAVSNGLKMRPQSTGGPKNLFRNLGNATNKSLQFDLRGRASNRDGVGATLYVTTPDGKVQYREQNGGYHRWSQNFQRVHVGVGTNTTADVEVRWPSGTVVIYPGLIAGVIYELDEDGTANIKQLTEPDADGDNIPDSVDTDDDNDGTPDLDDAFPFDPTETTDADDDGVGDNSDPFPNDSTNKLCNDPGFDNTLEAGTFLWKACGTEDWFLRVSGGGIRIGTVFTGTIDTVAGFTAINGFSIEGPDVLDVTSTGASYSLRVFNTGVDGIDFQLAGDACFTATGPADRTVYLGEGRTVLAAGDTVDLSTGEACVIEVDSDGDGEPDSTDLDDDNDGTPDTEDAFPLDPTETTDTDSDGTGDNADPFPTDPNDTACGEPSFSNSADRGTFVWRDCSSNQWHIRVTGGGTPTALDYQGSVTLGVVTSLTEVSIEGSDVITTTADGFTYNPMRLYNNGVDGLDFEAESGCFANEGPDGLPVYYGADRIEAGDTMNLLTGDPC